MSTLTIYREPNSISIKVLNAEAPEYVEAAVAAAGWATEQFFFGDETLIKVFTRKEETCEAVIISWKQLFKRQQGMGEPL